MENYFTVPYFPSEGRCVIFNQRLTQHSSLSAISSQNESMLMWKTAKIISTCWRSMASKTTFHNSLVYLDAVFAFSSCIYVFWCLLLSTQLRDCLADTKHGTVITPVWITSGEIYLSLSISFYIFPLLFLISWVFCVVWLLPAGWQGSVGQECIQGSQGRGKDQGRKGGGWINTRPDCCG